MLTKRGEVLFGRHKLVDGMFVMIGVGASILIFLLSTSSHIFGIDFAALYAAAFFTASGQPELVYHLAEHHAFMEELYWQTVPLIPYFYGPYTLLLFWPLSYLPYWWSLGVWQGLQMGFYLVLVYKSFRRPRIVVLALCFPAVFLNVYWGQNALFSTALLLGCIYFIDRNEILAGICLGILCYKPQLAIMCIVAVVANRKYRCLAMVVVVSGVAALSSFLLWGAPVWIAYLDAISKFADISLLDGWKLTAAVQPTLYSALRLAGVSMIEAQCLQYLCSVLLAGLVFWVWRRRSSNDALSIAILGFATMLGLSYYIQYDMLLAMVPLLYYQKAVEFPGGADYLLCGILWVLPVLSWLLVGLSSMQIAPVVFLMALLRCLERWRRQERESAFRNIVSNR